MTLQENSAGCLALCQDKTLHRSAIIFLGEGGGRVYVHCEPRHKFTLWDHYVTSFRIYRREYIETCQDTCNGKPDRRIGQVQTRTNPVITMSVSTEWWMSLRLWPSTETKYDWFRIPRARRKFRAIDLSVGGIRWMNESVRVEFIGVRVKLFIS